MMIVKVEETNKINVCVNDVFLVDNEYFMLVQSQHGFVLPSLSSELYLSEDKLELKTLEDVEEFIAKVRSRHEFKHFSGRVYNFDLTISSK